MTLEVERAVELSLSFGVAIKMQSVARLCKQFVWILDHCVFALELSEFVLIGSAENLSSWKSDCM